MTRIALSISCTVALAATLVGQQPASTLRGSWSATVGASRVLRGSWSATIDPPTPDRVSGAWALLDDRNRIVLEGTWAADKSARGWQGTWSARVATKAGRGTTGSARSGTWRADIKDPSVKTLTGLLQHAVDEQVSGTWRSGALEGGWRLQK
jgi:hypothetical protein